MSGAYDKSTISMQEVLFCMNFIYFILCAPAFKVSLSKNEDSKASERKTLPTS